MRLEADEVPVRFLLTEVDERAEDRAEDLPMLAVSITRGVIPREDSGSSQAASADVSHYKTCRPGDLVLNKLRAFQGGVGVASESGIVSPAYAVLRPGSELHSGFAHFIFRSDWFVGEMARRVKGIGGLNTTSARTPHINVSDLGNIKVPLPRLDVQRRVADMLDAETARIDQLIAKNKRIIKTMRVRRDEMVSWAVTEGVVGHRRTRPIDLGWTQVIAEDWDTASYQYVARIGTGHTPSRSNDEYWEDTRIPWVTTGDVRSLRDGYTIELADTAHHISDLGLRNSSATMHPAGTVFLSRTASVGFSGVMGQNMATSQDFVTWTCDEDRLVPHYLLFVLRAMKSRGLFDRMMFGSTHNTIYFDPLRQLSGPLPPRDEQERIVAYVLDRLPKYQTLEEKAARQIDLLETRRRSLITAAVTGQIDISSYGDT